MGSNKACPVVSTVPMDEVISWLKQAAAAKKCWACGCFQDFLKGLAQAFPEGQRPPDLDEVIKTSASRLVERRYDCLGCQVCFPAQAANALQQSNAGLAVELDLCPADKPQLREGWPPLPGDYHVIRYQAPVAVCTLNNPDLAQTLADKKAPEMSIAGTLRTENLGIERIITNVMSNPHLRFLILCGPDSRQTIGHFPGQSLMALARFGVDENLRIIGAHGKRPVLRNLSREAISHFRKTVKVIDLIGQERGMEILKVVELCGNRNPGSAEPFASEQRVVPIQGYLPERMVSDPAGYFVVYVDHLRQILSLEHYRNDGVLDVIIEGKTAAKVYIPAIEKKLVTRLDHAAYLGRELGRAEAALNSGGHYVQDAAPVDNRLSVTTSCRCNSSCEGVKP